MEGNSNPSAKERRYFKGRHLLIFNLGLFLFFSVG